jgi:hypothetical protein
LISGLLMKIFCFEYLFLIYCVLFCFFGWELSNSKFLALLLKGNPFVRPHGDSSHISPNAIRKDRAEGLLNVELVCVGVSSFCLSLGKGGFT